MSTSHAKAIHGLITEPCRLTACAEGASMSYLYKGGAERTPTDISFMTLVGSTLGFRLKD